MSNSYAVYVGNISTTVSIEKLKDLFSQVSEILSIWINPKYKTVTYGFIHFANLTAANEACERFNNVELDFCNIEVKPSNRQPKTYNRNSILLELPKKTGCTKEHTLKKILIKNLRENKEIVKDYITAYKEAEDIAFPRTLQMIKTAPERSDLLTLETTVKRYFKTSCDKNTMRVDFDLLDGKLVTTEQYDKFFNMQLTKQRNVTVTKPKPKPKIPFDLDYRSVCG